MRALRLIVVAAVAAAPLPAMAQHWAPGPAPGTSMAEQHRWEMERLRAEADRQAAFAARQQMETQLALMRLEAARQPPLPVLPDRVTNPPPAAAAPITRDPAAAAAQIDAWLDRAPRR